MPKLTSLSAALMMSATLAGADATNDYDYYIPAEPYEGVSFEIDVSCVLTTVQDFVGDFDRTDIDTGIIYAGNDNFNAAVAISEQTSSPNSAYVSWIEVSSPNTSSHINYATLMGSFSNAAYNEGVTIEGRLDARSLLDTISTCALTPLS